MVADHQHKMWAIGNTNLLAPITIPMWKTWARISEIELEHCKKHELGPAVIYLVYVTNPHFLLVGYMGTCEGGPSHIQCNNVL
jgi:hypothetical protein